MKKYILRNTYATIVALFIALFALPQQTQAQTKYDLWIAGTRVTSANCNDLSTYLNISGTVKYNPANKVLTLHNAKINCHNPKYAILSNIDDLKIKVVGTNNLSTKFYATLAFTHPLTIMGSGVLKVECKNGRAVLVNGTNLTIEDCTVNANGEKCGIAGENGYNEELIIKNATVTAIGKGDGSIRGITKLETIGCSITEPTGAKFDSSKHGVVLNGEIVKSKVVIKNNSTAIEAPTADNKAKQGIYTLRGVKLNGEGKDLPKGIYIVNGKKVVKK